MPVPDDFPPFELLPPDQDDYSADAQLAALEEVAGYDAIAVLPEEPDEGDPGRSSFRFDWSTGQTTGERVHGRDNAIQRCQAAVRTPKGRYPTMPPDVGREALYRGLGRVDGPELRADIARDLRQALLGADPAVRSVDDVVFLRDEDDELLYVDVTIVVGDERVTLREVPV